MNRKTIRSVCMFAALLCLCACAGQIGDSAKQDVGTIQTVNGGPASTRMVDVDRGTISAQGSGSAEWVRTDENGVERQSVGGTKRTLIFDQASGRVIADSGTDITAKNVDVEIPTPAGVVQRFRIGEISTSASEPTRATNEAYDRLVAYWTSRDQATRDRDIAAIKSLEATAPGLAELILKAVGVP